MDILAIMSIGQIALIRRHGSNRIFITATNLKIIAITATFSISLGTFCDGYARREGLAGMTSSSSFIGRHLPMYLTFRLATRGVERLKELI